jgi:hypothetical protein
MLKKVLWSNKSKWQIIGASTGVFVGMLLLLFALQVFLDMQRLMNGARDSNFLVLNKSVEAMGDRGFSKEELDTIQKQPFFNEMGVFESNRYEVYAKMDRLNVETFLFFQSVPTQFLDIDTTNFKWSPGDKKIPIVMSADYLTLYNFGFAASQGWPKFSKDVLKTFEFQVFIRGNGKRKIYTAYVCDFSDNVNSILVPKEFMQFANREFGRKQEANEPPNQVIVSTDNPYHKGLEKFLDDRSYEISRGGLIGGELKSALYLLIALVLVISIIIIGLSILVFVLNFQLLIEQSSQDIRLLMQIGYEDGRISKQLASRLIGIFLLIFAGVSIILFPLKYLLSYALVAQGYNLSLWLNPLVILTGLLFAAAFVMINRRVIQNSVRKLA